MYCVRCGHPLKPGGRFCAGCGQPVAAAPAPPAGSQAAPPPAAAKHAMPPPAKKQAAPPATTAAAPDPLRPAAGALQNGMRPAAPAPSPAPSAGQSLPGRSRHSAGLALAAAILVPGAGQAYNGQFGLGILVLLGSVLILPYFLGIWGAAHVAKQIAAAGGRSGRGGPAWILIQAMLGANLLLFTLVLLTVTGVLS